MAASPALARATSDELLRILMETMVAGVRADSPDLSARQLSVFLKVYLEPTTDYTVRRMAAELNVSKPAITRGLDRLGELGFTKREIDPLDRRSIIVRKTPKGSAYLHTLGGYMVTASKRAVR